jgi:uncharacterized protein (DUF2132 family)
MHMHTSCSVTLESVIFFHRFSIMAYIRWRWSMLAHLSNRWTISGDGLQELKKHLLNYLWNELHSEVQGGESGEEPGLQSCVKFSTRTKMQCEKTMLSLWESLARIMWQTSSPLHSASANLFFRECASAISTSWGLRVMKQKTRRIGFCVPRGVLLSFPWATYSKVSGRTI